MPACLRASIYLNLATTVSKCLFESSNHSFFSLPLPHHRARTIRTVPTMPLTEKNKAQVQVYIDAMKEAMDAIPEFDPDKVLAACEAVAKTHPISQDISQAYRNEGLTHKPLVLSDSPFLKPGVPWGLAVYRVSYSDDVAWDRMRSVLRQHIEESLVMRQAQSDLSSRHHLVLMDDQSKFEGAGPAEIREHFNSWSVDELRRNCRAGHEPPIKNGIPRFVAGPRYNYCFLVDDVCLESLQKMASPVVKLINSHWTPDSEQDEPEEYEDEEDEKLDWEGGETNCDLEDVGWMYVNTYDYIDIQEYLWEDENWEDIYVRPPLMRWENDFNEAPGFWRRSTTSTNLE